MAKKIRTAIVPTREENYPEWYQQIIRAAELAELSPVRGCMVIKPWGYSLWENIQQTLDKKFKATGHKNAYFPLFIPLGYMEKEAAHVEGFAKECAVVTHHRLEADGQGGLKPAGKLEEPLVVRPTSETIIGEMFARWVQSYRDLPLLINQWANIVRWEMRTRLFLRTTEFLWQEGHTAHATAEEAEAETRLILDLYADFAENFLAIPVIKGEKTESERFPGAVRTYCIEAMMQDRKALQGGTSHFLGQNFAKAAEIKFLDETGAEQFAWTTSWGVSTRLIGAMVMTHGDDNGLVIPPRLAPAHVVIIPIVHDDSTASDIMTYADNLRKEIELQQYLGSPLRVELDTRDTRGGAKVWDWIKKGVPIRIEIGKREVENDVVFFGRRDKEQKDRQTVGKSEFLAKLTDTLEDIQRSIYQRALSYREQNTVEINNKSDFYAYFTPKDTKQPEIHGGFALCHWNGSSETEAQIKQDLGVTIRCIPFAEETPETGKCIFTGEKSEQRVVFAKAY